MELSYISNKLLVKRLQQYEVPSIESVWFEVILPYSFFLVYCEYRPPNSNQDFWTHFQYSIGNAINYNPKCIITGDLNTDLLTIKAHKLLYIIDTFQFTQTWSNTSVPSSHRTTESNTLQGFVTSVIDSETGNLELSVLYMERCFKTYIK